MFGLLGVRKLTVQRTARGSTVIAIGGLAVALEHGAGSPPFDERSATAVFRAERRPVLRLVSSGRPPPSLDSLQPVFDSSGPYRVFRRGSAHVFALFARGAGRPYEVAVVDFAAGRGVLHVAAPRDPRMCAFEYPLSELVFSKLLADRRGAIVHACGVLRNGRGTLLAGHSGAGKSTLARLFTARGGVRVLSDDRVVVRLGSRGARLYGTPWSGTAGFAAAGSGPARRVVFLRHARRNRVRRLAPAEAAARLLALTVVPFWDRDSARRAIAAVVRLTFTVPCFDLGFVPGPRVLEVLERLAGR